MNFVFLSPHFPPYYRLFCQRLHEHGVRVLGIGDVAEADLPPELRDVLDEYYPVENLLDYDQLLRALGYFVYRYGRIDRLDSLNEYWLETEARLRTDFNIPGLHLEDARRIRQKSLMKQVFWDAGIPTAPFAPLTSLKEGQRFLAHAGYPAVIKRDAGTGPLRMVRDEADLYHFFARPHQHAYIIESYVPGQSVTFDGIVDPQGRILYAASHFFPDPPPLDAPHARHLAFHSLPKVAEDLGILGEKVLRAFGIRERFFHLEFIRLSESRQGVGEAGDLVALQVNMRAPGGMITDMMHYAGEVDVYGMWADMIVYGRLTRPTMGGRYLCGYASRVRELPYVHSHEAILKQYGSRILHHLPVPDLMAGAMGHYVYLFQAESEDLITEITTFIHLLDDRRKLPEGPEAPN